MSDVADAGQIPSPVTVPGVTVKGPMRQGYDRVLSAEALAFIAENKADPSVIADWRTRNASSLRTFWGHSPNDALEVKKAVEAALSTKIEVITP